MKPIVDDALLNRVSLLAKLELSEKEREQAREDLNQMLTYIDCLEKVDIEGVEPLYHVYQSENVFRDDMPLSDEERAVGVAECRLSENAPKMQDGCLVVPRTIGEKA